MIASNTCFAFYFNNALPWLFLLRFQILASYLHVKNFCFTNFELVEWYHVTQNEIIIEVRTHPGI